MQIIVLNTNFENIGVLDTYKSLIWTDRYSSCGDFEIYVTAYSDILYELQQGYYLWSDSSEHLMIIESVEIKSNVESGNYATITGRSLESILTRRIVWKKTVLNGKINSQIKKLITENIISPSDSKRKISNFIFQDSTDSAIDAISIRAQFTGDTLYDAIKSVCDTVNIGFKITLNANNQFVFSLYSGKDRSYDQLDLPYISFSPQFDNILNSDYSSTRKDFKNVTLVAGEGVNKDITSYKLDSSVLEISSSDGSSALRRVYETGDTAASGLDRYELFTDARDISSTVDEKTMSDDEYNALLQQRGNEKLAECKEVQAFDAEVETNLMYTFGKDYFMGDIVEFENEYGIQAKARVIEYIQSISTDGNKFYPTFSII